MSAAQRVIALDNIEAGLADEPGGGWLARCVRDGVLAEMQAHRPPTTAEGINSLLTSGLAGMPLLAALRLHFGDARRDDVFVGVASAVSLLIAENLLAQRDRDIVKLEAAGAGRASNG